MGQCGDFGYALWAAAQDWLPIMGDGTGFCLCAMGHNVKLFINKGRITPNCFKSLTYPSKGREAKKCTVSAIKNLAPRSGL
jgi:hypothetical protein